MSGVEAKGKNKGASGTGAPEASDARQPQIWEIILPPNRNWFRVRTRNPLRTLQKIFWSCEEVDEVAVKFPGRFGYVYVSRSDLEKLLEGEEVRLTITSGPPFNRWGICEAHSSGVFTRDDFDYDQWLQGAARYLTMLFGEKDE